MKKVKFTQMKDGTKEDYLILEKHEKKIHRRNALANIEIYEQFNFDS